MWYIALYFYHKPLTIKHLHRNTLLVMWIRSHALDIKLALDLNCGHRRFPIL